MDGGLDRGQDGQPMPDPADDAIPAALESALIGVADALAALPPGAFDRLCAREPAEIITRQQYFEASGGVPASFPPETLLGSAIIRRLAARHPLVMPDPDATGDA
jgi:hypothetical protein